ncbi:NAD-dependent malic enzyme [Amycolatopsis rhizosphaerae]|uniref:NAD-dependent malic enzyme n=1 Tax=Amycolatopsis rhizosphaerae TaxID=2053003 RepID=A0A558DEA1_9PSEU|nr:NAD-dependent malic enzyme [Amycolatopsis rhizosphaerae]TVT59340.1 NAD-dependent malic enzyme [Amycolatopsis rhizosphaerae]
MPPKITVLQDRFRNRGTAFTLAQRAELGITGRLPAAVETLDEQAARAYAQLRRQPSDLQKYIFLNEVHNRNQVLYFKLLTDHLEELLPVVYDPTVGDAIEQWSTDYRDSRAVYLSIDRPADVKASFESLGLGPDDVDLVVVSDAQEILGIGDWGVNGTDISIGKLAVYTAAAGIDPGRVVAVNLDVGTDNEKLLNSPMYLGNRHARVDGKRYDEFIALFLKTASEMFPHALLHFEDFGPSNARRILVGNAKKYRIFNDDMQGTGAIAMASVFSALKVTGGRWSEQRLLVFGAGTAGTGIADQIYAAMLRDGATPAEAENNVWLVDVNGLVTDDMPGLPDYQQVYARPASEVHGWAHGRTDLLTTIEHVKPTILLGTSTAAGAFTEDVVKALAGGVERPILLPLSNPTSRIEVLPSDAVPWSEGRALIAVGIPVEPVEYDGVTYTIGQANNALLYPGLGLGTIVSGARHVTDNMLLAAAEAVAGQVDVSKPGASLLPPVANLRASSATVALAVAEAAAADGVATKAHDNLVQAVQDAMWSPVYADEVLSDGRKTHS